MVTPLTGAWEQRITTDTRLVETGHLLHRSIDKAIARLRSLDSSDTLPTDQIVRVLTSVRFDVLEVLDTLTLVSVTHRNQRFNDFDSLWCVLHNIGAVPERRGSLYLRLLHSWMHYTGAQTVANYVSDHVIYPKVVPPIHARVSATSGE